VIGAAIGAGLSLDRGSKLRQHLAAIGYLLLNGRNPT